MHHWIYAFSAIVLIYATVTEACKFNIAHSCNSTFHMRNGKIESESVVFSNNDTTGDVLCTLHLEAEDAGGLVDLVDGPGMSVVCEALAIHYCPLCSNQTYFPPAHAGLELNFSTTCINGQTDGTTTAVYSTTTEKAETKVPTTVHSDEDSSPSTFNMSNATVTNKYVQSESTSWYWAIIVVVVVLLIVASIAGVYFYRRRASLRHSKTPSPDGVRVASGASGDSTREVPTSQQDRFYHSIRTESPASGGVAYENVQATKGRLAPVVSHGDTAYADCGPRYMNYAPGQGSQQGPAYLQPIPTQRPVYMDLS